MNFAGACISLTVHVVEPMLYARRARNVACTNPIWRWL